MKKTSLVVLLASFALVFASVGANAQTTGSNVVGSATPPPQAMPTAFNNAGFLQFNNLTVTGLTPASTPGSLGQIYANAATTLVPLPVSAGASSGGASMTVGVSNPCFQFQSAAGTQSTAIRCPVPPVYNGSTSTPVSYTIDVTATTRLMLSDRSVATLSSFAPGDTINVFGYYNTDGSIQAYVVRDLSKSGSGTTGGGTAPQSIQLNNVTLNTVAIAGTGSATLAVTQASGNPCFGFMGNTQTSIACPMGLSAFSANAATANVTPLPALVPAWQMLHKYVVMVGPNTTILDRNRNPISVSSLNPGDSLNVYGETSDGGQTVSADIIRDLSLPVAASTYTGTVTAVNADGSFVIQTNGGQTFTVQNPITVGTTVTVRGLAGSSGTISSVSSIMIGGTGITPVSTPATAQ
jgi:hypothetical protein